MPARKRSTAKKTSSAPRESLGHRVTVGLTKPEKALVAAAAAAAGVPVSTWGRDKLVGCAQRAMRKPAAVQRSPTEQAPRRRRKPRAASMPATPSVPDNVDALADFAAQVNATALTLPGWNEEPRDPEKKVYIGHVFRALQAGGADIDRETFNAQLLAANRRRLVTLARADLLAAMDTTDVAESTVRADAVATFNFVVVRKQPAEQRLPDESLQDFAAYVLAAARTLPGWGGWRDSSVKRVWLSNLFDLVADRYPRRAPYDARLLVAHEQGLLRLERLQDEDSAPAVDASLSATRQGSNVFHFLAVAP